MGALIPPEEEDIARSSSWGTIAVALSVTGGKVLGSASATHGDAAGVGFVRYGVLREILAL